MKTTSFSDLPLQDVLRNNLETLGYTKMTAIQAESLPYMLQGKDVIAQAETGSGKTAAFALSVLQKLKVKQLQPQALVLCPTRELADQVAKEIRRLARSLENIKVLTLCGGMPVKAQVSSLTFGAHIVVGTPGRIQDHIQRKSIQLQEVHTLVLDEADRMLDMGFVDAIQQISQHIPASRQSLLFSATYSGKVKTMAKKMLRNPKVIKVESIHDGNSIEQHFFELAKDSQKLDALRRVLLQEQAESAVVFCNTKREAQRVTDSLIADGFSALDLTGDLEQRDRDQTLIQFSNKSISILVATDVAARGLDIAQLDVVVNYDLAQDPESHVHRIGRTGRAGNQGKAFTFYLPQEGQGIALLEDYLQQTITRESLPDATVLQRPIQPANMQTLQIGGGKKQKISAGDILGALTSGQGITGKQVGKITIGDQWSYVAIERLVAKKAFQQLSDGKLKKRSFRVRLLQAENYKERSLKNT